MPYRIHGDTMKRKISSKRSAKIEYPYREEFTNWMISKHLTNTTAFHYATCVATIYSRGLFHDEKKFEEYLLLKPGTARGIYRGSCRLYAEFLSEKNIDITK